VAVSDHLRIASTELLKAADLVKQDIEHLRREGSDIGRSINNQVSDLAKQARYHENELRGIGSGQASQIHAIIQRIQQDIARKRSDIRTHQTRIDAMIRERQNLVNELESKARTVMP